VTATGPAPTVERHPNILDPAATALLVVDVQERFRDAIPEFGVMAAACARLVRSFRLLGLPIIVTEQYPRGLGRTVPEIAEALRGGSGEATTLEKTSFSSFGCAGVPEKLRDLEVCSIVVCGIETHVCVNQTVHDLLRVRYSVHVAADAVRSRSALDHASALRKMERSGAVLTTAEMAAFELMRDAKHPRFKEVQGLFK
jgi:nicotinamidase-related amidase